MIRLKGIVIWMPDDVSGRRVMQAQIKKGKNAQSKKAQTKGACSRGNREESNGDGNNVQCSGNYLSDDDSLEMTACSNVSSASRKSSSGGGKARAGRGAATDPQSLYARVITRTCLNDQMTSHTVSGCFQHLSEVSLV